MSHNLFQIPTLPALRAGGDVTEWARALIEELTRAFIEIDYFMMPITGSGRRSHQTLADGFTIEKDGLVITLDSAAAVTSSLTTAIKSGSYGDWLHLVNIGTFAITIKHLANTDMDSQDRIIAPQDGMIVVWTGTLWTRVSGA